MAASFGPDTPVLDYGPRAHADPGRRNDRVWLGWPAWAFRVVAPKLRSTRLNALQKAVLGVLRASKLTAAELGNRLGIHRELAAFVVADLRESACVDSKWAVTETGIGLLEEEQAESAELVPGWVFRDGLSERLLPFVAPALEYARMLAGDGPFRSLDLGTTGSPWRQTFCGSPNRKTRVLTTPSRRKSCEQLVKVDASTSVGNGSVRTKMKMIGPFPVSFSIA